tara:strand:+ start:822 stop:1511 length:690 start_codon:yes stop_codon:yes gene_type:complete
MEVLYSVVGKEKKKERFETILEPLQAITQLAILSFCPKGSKLSIANNLLYVQHPSWTQGLLRSYYQDARDDLYFLFNVIRRFNKFYKINNSSKINDHYKHTNAGELFNRLIELSRDGINNLIQTYSDSDKNALLHTLRMYRTMLENPNVFDDGDNTSEECDNKNIDNIDNIFIKITEIYKPYHINIIYNTINMISEDPENYQTYISGLNTILDPVHSQINKWVSDNIVF